MAQPAEEPSDFSEDRRLVLPNHSWANCTQLFTVDKARLEKRLGKTAAAQMAQVGEALKAVLEV